AEFFQPIARQGYAGNRPNVTQQGTYCFAPNGVFLGSDNTRDPQRMARLLESALTRWNALPKSQRLRSDMPAPNPTGRVRAERYRSEEHTSELQSLTNLVCRLLLEKKMTTPSAAHPAGIP